MDNNMQDLENSRNCLRSGCILALMGMGFWLTVLIVILAVVR